MKRLRSKRQVEMVTRRKTRTIYVGKVPIGGENPIVVQSMTKTNTADIKSTVKQIKSLETLGCEIIRLAVPDMNAAKALGKIKKSINIPMIADIHFDWRLALEAIEQGVDGLRINPGNIGASWKIKEVVTAARERGIPIRIGVNAGSLEKELLKKYGHPTPEALVESAGRHIQILEEFNFTNIKVSLKASEVLKTVGAYRLFSERYDYPLHIGISEAGPSTQRDNKEFCWAWYLAFRRDRRHYQGIPHRRAGGRGTCCLYDTRVTRPQKERCRDYILPHMWQVQD